MRKFLPIAAFLFAIAPAFGSFLFTLDQPTLSGAPGDTLIFTGTLSIDPLDPPAYLNAACVTFSTACDENTSPTPAFLTFDPNFFLSTVDGFLDASNNFTYTGPIFTISIDPSAPLGLYLGNATILGGAEFADFPTDLNPNFPGSTFDPLGSVDFQVVVTPEPATFGVLAAGLVFLAGLARRRRARAS
jgi:hypothetical protein